MATYFEARNLLAPYVDNGVAVTDTTRIDQRIDEAQRRLIDHYNFLSRREESARTPLVWQTGGTTGVATTGNLILDNLDATKNMILAIWREENNQLELSQGLETKAYSYIERNIVNDVERERRTAFEALATASNQNTFGGLAGRVGLETVAQYRVPESRIKSFINQAYQQAVHHYNFVSRREDKSRTPITFAALTSNATTFDPLIPIEVVRLLTLALIVTDSGGDGGGLKSQALELIDRNVTTLVEQTRRDAAGEEGRLHNELVEGVKVPTARMTTYLAQAATDAGAHWDFLARREDYSSGTKPNPFSFEVRKKLVESYIATANGAPDIATSLKQEAFSLIERDLMDDVETVRRALTNEEGRLHNELPEGVKIATGRLTTYLAQAVTESGAHWDFLARREDYSSGTTPNPFSFEVRKKLVESYIATANAAPDVAASLKQEALSVVERDLMAQVEAARRAAAGEAGQLHNELPEGVRVSTTRMNTVLAQAATEAGVHYDFLARREDYAGGTKPNPFAYEVRKKLVESYIATANAAPDVAASIKQEAFAIIERDLMQNVEAVRRTAAGTEGKLHNELPDGVKIPTARLTTYLTQAATEAGAHYDFLARREDYSSGTKPNPFSYEVLKPLVEGYIATLRGAVDVAAAKKQEASAIIERDLMEEVEAARRAAAGEEGQLHNELPEGVRIATNRLTTYLAQAATEAGVHWDFLARREDYSSGVKPNPFPYETRKKMVESYIATANAAPDVAASLKQEAFATIERDLMTGVEAARRATAGEAGRLHNELPEGVRIATSRMTEYLSQAAAEAGAHWDFLARRENYSSGTKPNPFTYEVRKKFVESYVATGAGQIEAASALKAEGQALIERDLMAQVEAARRAASGDEGKLHNELPNGVTIPTARLTTYLSQASTEIGAQQDFLQRREDYNGPAPTPTYEQKKLMVESYLATSAGQPEVATALKQQALALIERDVMAAIEAARRSTREALLASANDTFGYHWGRIGLELPEAYRLSDSAVKRMVNAAEEQLMFAGKWVGTVAEYTLSVSTTGEFFLPREVETILYMSFDGDPKPVHDRLNEWIRGGTGYRETDDKWREGAVDRGEAIDPVDGFLKRKYWITLPNVVPVVRILAKRRFVPHTADADTMYLRNYQAIYEATKGILLGGEQITPHIEKAKEMLASQIAQQNFTGNRGAAHTRRVYQFR
jgi:predicted urease superfamily metal-dependent hydrolase